MEQKTERPIFLTTIIVCIANFTYELVSNIISIVNIINTLKITDVRPNGIYSILIINILLAIILTTSIVLSGLCISAWNKSEKELNKKKVLLFIIFAINILLAIYNIIGLFIDFDVTILINLFFDIAVAVFVMLEIYNNFKILKSQTVDNAKEIEEVKDVEAVETMGEKETANEETTEETKEVLEETVETEEAVETVEEKVEPKE